MRGFMRLLAGRVGVTAPEIVVLTLPPTAVALAGGGVPAAGRNSPVAMFFQPST